MEKLVEEETSEACGGNDHGGAGDPNGGVSRREAHGGTCRVDGHGGESWDGGPWWSPLDPLTMAELVDCKTEVET